jgi:hypothetical protein
MPAIRVTLAVQQWQVHSGQALRITGLWTVRKTSETTSDGVSSAQREGRWVVERPIEGRAVNAAVRSESEAIAELSRPIAEAIAELTATKGF